MFSSYTEITEEYLNSIGRSGWELVNIINLNSGFSLIFKKTTGGIYHEPTT